MGTTVVKPATARRPANKRYERVFFAGMSLLILILVMIGFWPTYYGAGIVKAPLPNTLVHLHGAVFSLWILMFLVQVGLVSARRVRWHRTLGLVGMGLAALVVAVAFLASSDWLRRSFAAGDDPRSFYIVMVTDPLLFGVLMLFAYLLRSKPDAHKRLALLATLTLVDAAIFRIHLPWLFLRVGNDDLVVLGLALLLVAYDLFSLGRIHRATVWGLASCAAVYVLRAPVGTSAIWYRFADFMAGKG
jgi:hypothetical protein